jgi:hypothetical protein
VLLLSSIPYLAHYNFFLGLTIFLFICLNSSYSLGVRPLSLSDSQISSPSVCFVQLICRILICFSLPPNFPFPNNLVPLGHYLTLCSLVSHKIFFLSNFFPFSFAILPYRGFEFLWQTSHPHLPLCSVTEMNYIHIKFSPYSGPVFVQPHQLREQLFNHWTVRPFLSSALESISKCSNSLNRVIFIFLLKDWVFIPIRGNFFHSTTFSYLVIWHFLSFHTQVVYY